MTVFKDHSAAPKYWFIVILNIYQSLPLSFNPLDFTHLSATSY